MPVEGSSQLMGVRLSIRYCRIDLLKIDGYDINGF
jgi:hypothetical protein